MTIDEAIKHAKEQQEIFGGKHKEFLTNVAGWLEELKNLKPSKKGFITIGQTVEEFEKEIRANAINEFAERLKSDEFQKYNLDMVFETSRDLSYSDCIDAFHEYIDEVSEQLKDGGENEY